MGSGPAKDSAKDRHLRIERQKTMPNPSLLLLSLCSLAPTLGFDFWGGYKGRLLLYSRPIALWPGPY